MQPTLTPIETKIHEGYVVIPVGMTLVFLYDAGDRYLAYVQGWTAAGEYDATYFDLYSLQTATQFIVPFKKEGQSADQT